MERENVDVGQLVDVTSSLQDSFPRGPLHYPFTFRRAKKMSIFTEHPRMHDKLNFASLYRIYEQTVKDAEEKMSSLLINGDVTASLNYLDVQMLTKKIIFNRRHCRLTIICPV
jgi:hypothetical protein